MRGRIMDNEDIAKMLYSSCEELISVIQDLQEENTILTDAIINANLGKTAQKYRVAEKNLSEAKNIRNEYEERLNKVIALFTDIKQKQENIDAFIDSESEKKTSDIKNEMKKYKILCDKNLEENKKKIRKQLKIQTDIYKKKFIHLTIITLICVIITIVMLVGNFI